MTLTLCSSCKGRGAERGWGQEGGGARKGVGSRGGRSQEGGGARKGGGGEREGEGQEGEGIAPRDLHTLRTPKHVHRVGSKHVLSIQAAGR